MKKTIILLLVAQLWLSACSSKTPSVRDAESGTPPATEETDGSCDKACENYALCASYGEDVTPQDVDDAFASCMEECAGWAKENTECMAKVNVRNPEDCGPVSLCGLKNYGGLTE